jgi:restriction system protein
MYWKKDIEKIIWIMLLWPIILILILLKIPPLKKRFKNKNYLSKQIEELTPYEFEHYIAELFKKMGYKSRTTNASGDYGVDVIAKNKEEIIAIQVKKYKGSPVGNKEVQRLLGAMQMKKIQADRCILITTSRFTQNAINQAEGCPIELWDGKDLAKIIKKYLD